MIALFLVACLVDDYTGEPYEPETGDTEDTEVDTDDTSVDTSGDDDPAIVGEWVSQGDDLSDLFSSSTFGYESVTALFRANGSYSVEIIAEDDTYSLSGSYTVNTSTEPATIVLQQADAGDGDEATAKGIWSVSGSKLTYEVVQTIPDYGYTPPTPSTGFGSTSGPNLSSGINVQTYRQ